MESPEVTNNRAGRRFEVNLEQGTAYLVYRQAGNTITLVHTEVPAALGGRGIAGALAKAGLEYARANGLRVIPSCPFVKSYLERHPEYQDLVTSLRSR